MAAKERVLHPDSSKYLQQNSITGMFITNTSAVLQQRHAHTPEENILTGDRF